MTRPKSSQREAWTPLGASWWDWAPLAQASANARLLWLALYTSAPARRCPPGLWQGGCAVMAEVSHLDLGVVEVALAELQALRLVECDPTTRVVRLVVLPDQLDRPANGDQIRSWWTRWRTLPACTVRDSHVETLRALVGRFTEHHTVAWGDTFGTVPTPLRVPARAPLGHGGPHGGGHRDGHGAGHGVPTLHGPDIAGSGHGAPHGGGHRQGEGEGSSSSDLRSGSHPRSSREITTSDPTVTAAWESFERHFGGEEVNLVEQGLRRYGPRGALLPEAPSSERFK